jgi:excisionase family DNA binding protein
MDTHKNDGRPLRLRVSEWLRVSAWLLPGAALTLFATLATLIHNIGVVLAVWGATVWVVLIIVLPVRWALRRDGSPSASKGKPVLAGPASPDRVSTGTTPTATATEATDQHLPPGASRSAVKPDGKIQRARDAGVRPPGSGDVAHPSMATDRPLAADKPQSPTPAALIAPELRVLTATEVASVLRVDLDLVISSITDGQLPGNRIGNHWRIDQGALMQWLQGTYGISNRDRNSG